MQGPGSIAQIGCASGSAALRDGNSRFGAASSAPAKVHAAAHTVVPVAQPRGAPSEAFSTACACRYLTRQPPQLQAAPCLACLVNVEAHCLGRVDGGIQQQGVDLGPQVVAQPGGQLQASSGGTKITAVHCRLRFDRMTPPAAVAVVCWLSYNANSSLNVSRKGSAPGAPAACAAAG